jgi:Family of unknown function (DUF6328)
MSEDDDRDESEEEKFDRQWNEMLQELRVVQTGVQLLSGFLLTLPFTTKFDDLDTWQVRLYLALVLTSGLAVGVTLTPIIVHRRVFGQRVKERVVMTGHALTQVVMFLLAVIIVGISTLIFSVVISWSAAIVVAVCATAVLVTLLVVVPILIGRSNSRA